MAFFGLTQLGYQAPIRAYVRDPDITPQYVFESGMYRTPGWRTKFPPIGGKKDLSSPSIVPVDQVSAYGRGPQGSHIEYTRMKTKHVRSPKECSDIYRHPVVTSAQIGQWRRDEPLYETQPWAYVPRRYAHINSEMTRFVDEMTVTNREFSLF